MTNMSAVNAEATPYSQVRNSQEYETDSRTGNCKRRELETNVFHIREQRRSDKFSSVMEMLQIAEENLLDTS